MTLCIALLSLDLKAQENIAPDITFTDLNGVSHNLYTYLDSGYTVILDFSYEYCGTCFDWSLNVGHDLWAHHGLSGDNTIRMFHFDIDPRSDEDVLDYTQEWGIEYPVINLQADLPEYPLESFPTLHFVCPDSTYNSDFGYGHPLSYIHANYLISQCTDNPIPDSNITFVSASPALTNTMCNSTPLTYIPTLHLSANEVLDSPIVMDQFYNVEVFINDTLFSTVNIDPDSDGSIGSFDDPVLSAIAVDFNDEITMVAHYPGDTHSADDTVKVTIPSQVLTSTSSDTVLEVVSEGNSWLFFDVFDPEGEYLFTSEDGQTQFALPVDSCYSISISSPHLYSASLKDANGNTLLSYEAGVFTDYMSPRLYFHVSDTATVSVNEHKLSKRLIRTQYFDMLGRQHIVSSKDNLPKGLYLELRHYNTGHTEVKKRYFY